MEEMNKEMWEVMVEAPMWRQWQKGSVNTADKTVTVTLAHWVQSWGTMHVYETDK